MHRRNSFLGLAVSAAFVLGGCANVPTSGTAGSIGEASAPRGKQCAPRTECQGADAASRVCVAVQQLGNPGDACLGENLPIECVPGYSCRLHLDTNQATCDVDGQLQENDLCDPFEKFLTTSGGFENRNLCSVSGGLTCVKDPASKPGLEYGHCFKDPHLALEGEKCVIPPTPHPLGGGAPAAADPTDSTDGN